MTKEVIFVEKEKMSNVQDNVARKVIYTVQLIQFLCTGFYIKNTT